MRAKLEGARSCLLLSPIVALYSSATAAAAVCPCSLLLLLLQVSVIQDQLLLLLLCPTYATVHSTSRVCDCHLLHYVQLLLVTENVFCDAYTYSVF